MKRVTRAVPPESLCALLLNPPRATLAFVREGEVNSIPVAFRWPDGRYLVGLNADSQPPAGRVKLLVDDGPWYFDLRGIWVRGALAAIEAPADSPDGYAWFELVPEKVAAWHYGRMRELKHALDR
jgi:hypothetical protein